MLQNMQTKRSLAILLIAAISVMSCLSVTSYGAGRVSISHSTSGFTSDGPTITLDVTLEIVNNTTAALSEAEITTAPMGPLSPIIEETAVYIGDIAASGTVSVSYTIVSASAMREEAMNNLPIFWELSYADQTGQPQMMVVQSRPLLSEVEAVSAVSSSAVPVSSLAVTEKWVARYNGSGNFHDYAVAMAVDGSGNVYVTGYSYEDSTFDDHTTIKYDTHGNQLWNVKYNGPGNSGDYGTDIAVDSSGNVYVTGYSYGGHSTYNDYATIKYDTNGNLLWVARYNGSGSSTDYAHGICVDSSGNVYVTGKSWGGYSTSWDYATVGYNGADGSPLWAAARYDGAEGADVATALAVDSSGGVYVTGYSNGGTNHDYVTIKYDTTNGGQLWTRRYDGGGDDRSNDIGVDSSGNVYVTGYSYGDTYYDYVTFKYNGADGSELWEAPARYDGPGTYPIDMARALDLDGSGNVYVTGRSRGSGIYDDYATVKYDTNGNQQWAARYNGPGDFFDTANDIAVDGSGNVYVTGYSYAGTNYDYATIKYDPSGAQLWAARYNGPGNWADQPSVLAVDSSGDVYVAGMSFGSGTGADYATIKYSSFEDPADAIAGLVTTVISLNLQQGISNSLDAKLGAALQAIDDVKHNNDVAAINTLEAFINAVAAQRGGKVSETDADDLIAAAQQIIDLIMAG